MSARTPARRNEIGERRAGIGRPPLPREHGAWVMLYAPMLVGLIAAGAAAVPALLLCLTATGAFLAQNALRLLLRRRGDASTERWYAVFVGVAAVGLLPLLLWRGLADLLVVALAGGLLFGVHSALQLWPAKKRLDRSQWGELLAVPGLCLTAPAAVVVASGTLTASAWLLWAACTLFFSSGVFNVKMILASAKYRNGLTPCDRLTAGRDNLAYHCLLAAGIAALVAAGGRAGLMLAIGYAPALVRAAWQYATLSGKLPAFHRVGIRETVLALWFAGWAAAAFAGML